MDGREDGPETKDGGGAEAAGCLTAEVKVGSGCVHSSPVCAERALGGV